MEFQMKLAGFIPASASDGPGIRSVLFLQGCSRYCLGCHNNSLQDSAGGYYMSCSKIIDGLRSRCRNKKLTISGGEPLEQFDALRFLLDALGKDGFNLCLYTGFEIEQVPSELMAHLHYLKTGPFLKNAQYPSKPFVGSNNQNFYQVEHGKDGKICLIEI